MIIEGAKMPLCCIEIDIKCLKRICQERLSTECWFLDNLNGFTPYIYLHFGRHLEYMEMLKEDKMSPGIISMISFVCWSKICWGKCYCCRFWIFFYILKHFGRHFGGHLEYMGIIKMPFSKIVISFICWS